MDRRTFKANGNWNSVNITFNMLQVNKANMSRLLFYLHLAILNVLTSEQITYHEKYNVPLKPFTDYVTAVFMVTFYVAVVFMVTYYVIVVVMITYITAQLSVIAVVTYNVTAVFMVTYYVTLSQRLSW